MKAWKRDVIYSAVIIIVCSVLWINANSITTNAGVSVKIAQPLAFTRLVLGILTALAAVQLVRALVKRSIEEREPVWDRLSLITVVSCVIYVFTLKLFGFMLNSFVLMSILYISYSSGAGKIDVSDKRKMWKQILIRIVFSAVFVFVIDFVFRNLLKSRLPTFSLF